MSKPGRARRLLKHAALGIASLVFAAAVSEALILLALARPGLVRALPARLQRAMTYLYMYYDRDVIQMEPAFAHYDERLFYTLTPGRFTFANREFSTEVRVNSLGVRDDEAALADPEVVVAGDSYAMGWGVAQEQTFAKRLEAMTELKVLNTGVSSYGASRELTLLDRVRFSRVKYLVIQHCDNDFEEDEEFERSGNRLVVGSRQELEHAQQHFLQNRRYWFGRYLYKLLFRPKGEGAAAAPEPEPDWDRRAEQFLNVLAHASKQKLDGVQVIVFDMGSGPEFLRALERNRKRATWPGYIQRMKVLNVAELLDDSHYMILDDHLNPAGHERIATELADTIEDL